MGTCQSIDLFSAHQELRVAVAFSVLFSVASSLRCRFDVALSCSLLLLVDCCPLLSVTRFAVSVFCLLLLFVVCEDENPKFLLFVCVCMSETWLLVIGLDGFEH